MSPGDAVERISPARASEAKSPPCQDYDCDPADQCRNGKDRGREVVGYFAQAGEP
jgi:hypothetical protein